MGSRVLDVGIESDTTDIQRVTSTITNTHPLRPYLFLHRSNPTENEDG